MKGRKQKIFEKTKTWPQKNRMASDGYEGGQTFMWITENNLANSNGQLEYGLLEFILSPSNLNKAYLRVMRNKGSGGIDGMEVGALKEYLIHHKDALIVSILKGTYRPNPVRRVEIPKDNRSKRQLGIPTVVDRVIQQAIFQVLNGLYEPQFSDNSYGFRPRRNAHHALQKCREYITEGYSYVVDRDLEKFFDTVHHSKLIEILSRTVKDGRVISLIHRYLNAGVQMGHSYEAGEKGVPQGGPLSPLLGNVMLNELDRELEKRGHRFARYADDFVAKLKELTSRSNGWGNERRRRALGQYIIGWVHYYKLADMKAILLRIDEWYRRRLRMVPWKQTKTKMRNLVKLGINKYKAGQWTNTRKSYWYTANSSILTCAITNGHLKRAGYVFLSDYYQNVRAVN